VLDPFFGTGTSGVVARRLGRNFLGLERDADYARLAEKRLAQVAPPERAFIETLGRREEPRIPFGWLVEQGLLQPGEILFDPARRWTAKVRADGTIISADHRGSIHRVAAALQGAAACNGWTFWMVERNGRPVPIDLLRQQLRAGLH
jgi:modification methylase